MNTRISPNGQHANAGSNRNGTCLRKVGESGERTNCFMQEQPEQLSAQPIRRRFKKMKMVVGAIAVQRRFIDKGFDPVAALKQAYTVIKSIVQRDAFIMAFNDAFLVIAIGLLVSAIAVWIVKVSQSASAPVLAQ